MRVLLLNFGYELVLRKLTHSQNLKIKLTGFIYGLDFTFSARLWFSLICLLELQRGFGQPLACLLGGSAQKM